MSQRGVSREMVELVRDYGVQEGDKLVLGRRDAAKVIDQLMEKLRVLKKIQDKGGLVVVETGESLITTYNLTHPRY
jgi:hypothetical protein